MKSQRFPFPLKTALREPTDEQTLQRMWRQIGARVAEQKRPRFPMRAVAVGVAALALATVGVVALRRDAGPLRQRDGRPVVAFDAHATGDAIALRDGSRIELAPGAHFEPLETTGAIFSGILERGSAQFEVRPGGPRRWVIECGLATVEVLGTRFGCVRTPGRLRVTVDRGTVLVKGERVPDRVRRLVAGEVLDIVEAQSALEPDTAPSRPLTEAAPSVVAAPVGEAARQEALVPSLPVPPSRHPSAPRLAEPVTSWQELARSGRNGEAFQTLGAEGIRREAKLIGVEDLLALADVARLSGHPADAVGPLERVLAEFATDPQAPLAAFALGRLQLDSLQRPTSAAAAFQRALDLGVPTGLREDARARLVESFARAGDRASAQAAAADYTRAFPRGRHARAIERWLAEP